MVVLLKAKQLVSEGYASNARLYSQTATILGKFVLATRSSAKLPIRELTPGFLKSFQNWMLNRNYIYGNSKLKVSKTYSVTTLGMYLIRVRAIVNSLIRSGHLSAARNPFGKEKYLIPKSKASKRPLTHEEITRLAAFRSENEKMIFARDMFIFSYLANGMNFYDILKLKWTDIDGDAFYFVRRKTASKLPDKKIRVFINQQMEVIIDKYCSKNGSLPYLFDILTPESTLEDETKN